MDADIINELDAWTDWFCIQVELHACTKKMAREKNKIPHTGSLLLWPAMMVADWLQKRAFHFALDSLVKSALPSPFTLVSMVVSQVGNMALMPTKNTEIQKTIDTAIDTYAKKGERKKDFLNELAITEQHIMILLVSVTLLYFQYKGMTSMKEENKKYQTLTALIDENRDGIQNKLNLEKALKPQIYALYNDSKYYKKNSDDNAAGEWIEQYLNPSEYSVLRTIYNTLVGLNSTLFYCMGSKSHDPASEIFHWTKALLYWEILARLVHQKGMGPVQLAGALFLRDLYSNAKEKKGKFTSWF